jgi:hypothetical protein
MRTRCAAPSAMWPHAQVMGTLVDLELDELSGLVEAAQPGTFWTHNDSGAAPTLFLIDGADSSGFRQADLVTIAGQFAQNDLEQGRLADAVPTHQADLGTRWQADRGVVQKLATPGVKRQVGDLEHGRAIVRKAKQRLLKQQAAARGAIGANIMLETGEGASISPHRQTPKQEVSS